MTCETCRSFSVCSAPLCPLDRQSLERGSWYADEETCTNVEARHGVRWITLQRRIQRRCQDSAEEACERGYFTHAMLEAVYGVTPSIKGLNPDHDLKTLSEMERTWIAKRSRPEVPQEEQERRRELGRRLGEQRRLRAVQKKGEAVISAPSEDGKAKKVSEDVSAGEVPESLVSAPSCAENAVSEAGAVFGRKTPVGEEV
jgi:hypothetical protein